MKASGWKRRIVAACKTAGTYGEQYMAVIDTLAAIPDNRGSVLYSALKKG